MSDAIVMLSQRGRELLVFKNHKFYKGDLTQQGQKWRCVKRKCTAKLFVDSTNDVLPVGDHNHEICEVLARQFVSNSVKRKAVNELSATPAKIIRKEITSVPREMQQNLTRDDVKCIKRNLYIKRRQQYPPLPKNRDECHDALECFKIESNEDENMLLFNDRNSNIVIFSTKKNLNYLTKCKTVFMDGTFSYCAKFFTQMFTMHIVENGNYVPLVFCLLPDKKTETYTTMFRKLLELCQESGEDFSPETFVVDFEQAIHNAVYDVWPTSKLTGKINIFYLYHNFYIFCITDLQIYTEKIFK